MTLAEREPPRKAWLKAACALAGITIQLFAERQGVTTTHLYAVLDAQRESVRLIAEIDAFIAEQFAKVSAA